MLVWAEKEIELIQDGGQINREKDIYHHDPGPISTICQLPGHPCFSSHWSIPLTHEKISGERIANLEKKCPALPKSFSGWLELAALRFWNSLIFLLSYWALQSGVSRVWGVPLSTLLCPMMIAAIKGTQAWHFFWTFLAETETIRSQGPVTRDFWKLYSFRPRYSTFKHFRACSACDEIGSDSSSKKFGSAYAQSPRKCSNIKILAKIEGKDANFFRKFTKGI